MQAGRLFRIGVGPYVFFFQQQKSQEFFGCLNKFGAKYLSRNPVHLCCHVKKKKSHVIGQKRCSEKMHTVQGITLCQERNNRFIR